MFCIYTGFISKFTNYCFSPPDLLVSITQHDDSHEYYREHVLFYDLTGYLHGIQLCLGRGPRSFLPVYLHGNREGEERQPEGWYVYMRDGKGGILCVSLLSGGM